MVKVFQPKDGTERPPPETQGRADGVSEAPSNFERTGRAAVRLQRLVGLFMAPPARLTEPSTLSTRTRALLVLKSCEGFGPLHGQLREVVFQDPP
jgi:hypothetical protein